MNETLNELLDKAYPDKQLPDSYEKFLMTLENKYLIDKIELIEFFYGDRDCVNELLSQYDYCYQWHLNIDKHTETIVSLSENKSDDLSTIYEKKSHQNNLESENEIEKPSSVKDQELDMFFDFNDYIKTDEFKQRMEEDTNITTHKDNTDLIDNYQYSNNISTRNEVIENNMGLIESIVTGYSWAMNSTSLSKEDLVSYGVFGLIKAIEKFDSSMGNEFSTYAYYWIRQSISRSIADEAYVIRIPVHMQDDMSKIRKLETKYEEYQDKVLLICEEMEITAEKYREILNYQNAYMHKDSLNALMRAGESKDEKITLLSSESSIFFSENEYFCSPEDLITKKIYEEEVLKIADEVLKEQEKEVIYYRFGMKTGKPETLEFVGKIFGVTRERIRQIEAKALEKIKKYIAIHWKVNDKGEN